MSGQTPQQQPNRMGWNRGPPSPIHYRPPSPWAASPPPILSSSRRSINSPGAGLSGVSPVASPINSISRSQPMSPVPTTGNVSGLRGTRGINVTHPRPRWPGPQNSPQPHSMVSPSPPTVGGAFGPRPFRPMHSYSPGPTSSFQLSPTPSPVVCPQSNDFLYSAHYENAPTKYEYVGVPLEPPQPKSYIIYDEEEDQGPSTAEIIANQSQDYIDEKLAEYQMTILQLQEEQERVQKKTFVNWINSYLSKRIPPLRIDDLIHDLRDGTKLLALLEVLSGEKLPVEKGRVLRRPHFLSNANTALQFLASKKIKLVNINPADLVDGRPPVVLGLIWTIILYFQIEENSRALQYLSHGISGSVSSLDSISQPLTDVKAEKWKLGARKTLLQWVTNALPKDAGIEIRDFGASWRDGVAFLALIDAIKANLINLAEMKKSSNRARLETAFDVAETKLGIAKLLDAEDVDVEKPDEKSIMTYVAQFLHKYPEPKGTGSDGASSLREECDQIFEWLQEKVMFYQPMFVNKSFPIDFGEYLMARAEMDTKIPIYNKLRNLVESQSNFCHVPSLRWQQTQELWKQHNLQLYAWLWLLDSELPAEFGVVGKWLMEAEKMLMEDSIPVTMNEETASIISTKLEEHKSFFADLPKISKLFENGKQSLSAHAVPLEQIANMERRLLEIGHKSSERRIRLKFLEHKCCLIAFLNLVENKLRMWSGKYGTEEKILQVLEQYKNFVSKNKIFQEFNKALDDMQQVVEEYKRDGNISSKGSKDIDKFMVETEDRWKRVSMELRCCQNTLEEVSACWKKWNTLSADMEEWLNLAESKVGAPEDDRLDFFQNIGKWRDSFEQLSEAADYLIASCEDYIALQLKAKFADIAAKWEKLFLNTKQYMHAGDIIRSRREYQNGVEKLTKWLQYCESILEKAPLIASEHLRKCEEQLQQLFSEIDAYEELFKTTSRTFQNLIQDLSRDEVDKMMKTLKAAKESLVRIRAQIPIKLHLFHQLLIQQESLEAGQKEIHEWLDEAENLLGSLTLSGGKDNIENQLSQHKIFFSKTLYYKSMVESKNKVFQTLLASVEANKNIDTTGVSQKMQQLNDRFDYVSRHADQWETRLQEVSKRWFAFRESERIVSEWLSQAESLLSDQHVESKHSIESQKLFFECVHEKWMNDLVQTAQDLLKNLTTDEQTPIVHIVEKLQEKWREALTKAPLHLTSLEFKLNENNFQQYIKEIDRELQFEQQALNKNEDVEVIWNRNNDFFKKQGIILKIEKSLETMKKISNTFGQNNTSDTTLSQAYSNAEKKWCAISEKIESIRKTLQQIPAQWSAYHQKFLDMGSWMDMVDRSLKKVATEVDTMEEFEKERIVFQKICHDADNKREDMKWLVKTLDSLLSYASEEEAKHEQKKLEELIARYKNLIPTIEVTMIKTEVYSKCYTYRREVHEVVSLLKKVVDQTVNAPQPESLDKVNKMILEQQYAIGQLDHQRTHIMSMLQRGRDLSKDVHAPAFVNEEVKTLESGWSEAYSETVEKLRALKSTQIVWNNFLERKNEIVSLLANAERELRSITPLQTDPKNVSSDLKAKQELNIQLLEASKEIIPKLHELRAELSPLTAMERRPVLEKEVTEIEKMFFNTMENVKDRVGYLEDYSAKWNTYKSRLLDLQEWANKVAPKLIESLESQELTPEERAQKTNNFHLLLQEKMKYLDALASDAADLAPKQGNIAEAKRLKGEISKLKETLTFINRNMDHKARAVKEDLLNWQKYQAEIKDIRPVIENFEKMSNAIFSKPVTLQEALQLQQQAYVFENECEKNLSRLQQIALIGSQMFCKTNAPDEIDTIHSRWSAVQEISKQNIQKVNKIVLHWQNFDAEARKLELWVENSDRIMSNKPYLSQTPQIEKLETELVKLKSFNNEVSEQQAKLISLSQNADQIGLCIAPEGAVALKERINSLKGSISKLSEATRARINEVSDAIMARQDFNAKMANFDNWMGQLRTQTSQIDEVSPERVEVSLNIIHALIQEHSDKNQFLSGIYDEIKNISMRATPEESLALNESYTVLVGTYQGLQNNLHEKKATLEKWNELLSWKNETDDHINHMKYQLETTGKLEAEQLEGLFEEIEDVSKSLIYWKAQAKHIEDTPAVQLRDSLSRKPLIATHVINDLENKLENLKLKYQNQKMLTDQMDNRKQKFHELENSFTKDLHQNRLVLNNLIKESPNYANIDQIISDLVALNDVMLKKAAVKDKLRDEGNILMNEDIANMPVIQESLLSLDKNWENLQQEILDRINKYTALSQALKEYSGTKEKFEKELQKSNDMFGAISSEPKDEIELANVTEKTRRALEQTKKTKSCVEDLERKCNNLIKLYEAVGEVLPIEINNEVESSKEKLHNTQEKILKTAHLHETEAVIWRQIEDAKNEILPWLAETNQGLCDAAENSIEIEFGPMRLNKYTIELPSYTSLKHDIEEKTNELAKINNGAEIPVLKTLNELLTQQFQDLEQNAQKLNMVTVKFTEQEKGLQTAIKTCGENVSKLRENLIKCDDMSGDSNKITERLVTCRKLKNELTCVGEDIDNLHVRVDEMKGTYPTFSESIIPKEFYNVQKRYRNVLAHAMKVESTLMQFLKKFHNDKVGILQRMLATQKEKIAWCSPDTSSDKYNLDVKKSALQDAISGLEECKLKQADIVKSIHLLKKVDTPENFAVLQKEIEDIDTNLQILTDSLNSVKAKLEDNVALWAKYETLNENILGLLRDIEGKVKLETSCQVDLDDCDKKLHELIAMANQIKEQRSTMDELEKLSKLLTEKNPEARTGHLVNHSSVRYQTVAKSLASLMDRLDNTRKSFCEFEKKVEECSEWLNDTKIEFNELARMGSPGSSSATAQQLNTIKEFVKTFIHGQENLNEVVIIGENLYPLVTPHNRDKIRNELRKLRENFDFLREESNALLQQVEGVLIQKTSIEESHAQVSHWLDELKGKIGVEVELYPNLATKKAALQAYKSHLQQINLHTNALKQLQEKASNLADGDAARRTEESIIEYEKLRNIIADRIEILTNQVLNHEVYDQILEKALDWLSTIKTESIDILNETTFEKEGAEDKLIIVENLIHQKPEGDKIFEACGKQLQAVLEQTNKSGHPVLQKWFEEPKKAWNEFMNLCEDSLVKLRALCTKWDEFENVIDNIDVWMKNIESVVKDQTLKSTVEMKEIHLKKLREMMEDIKDKGPAIQDLMEQGREIDGETDLNLKLSRLNTRFQTLKNLCIEAISKYEIYVKDHNIFNRDFEVFKNDLHASINELANNNEIVGDLSILQERQNKIRELSDKRINDSTLLEVLIDRGEKLYGHTSPEGREIIRHQLRTVRTMWDNYTDDLNSASQKLDHCLLQFGEFTLTQEQLTKWLKDIEKAMQNHTELKNTLQEKRAQLQNHKLMHQEILAHSTLVDNVCDKAQNLVDQTKDTSLNTYLLSIKELFQNIVNKSEDLLKNLESSVQVHMDLNAKIGSAKTWIASEKQKLLDCDDFFGEKADVKRKISHLGNLRENKAVGLGIMDDIKKHLDLVRRSTSTKGIEAIEKELSEFEEDMKNHFNDVEGMELKQNDALKQWNDFEKNLEELTKWCRSAESVFRDQQLQPGVEEKSKQLEKYKDQREKILKKEKEIDSFADDAHILLNNSGADRLKTLISQITNRYQLLQVLSKEVVNRWHTLVEDHQHYNDKLKEVELWLQPIESQLETYLKEDNVLDQNVLQLLLSKKDQAENLLSSLNSLGEKILPDTSTIGREKTRQELRNVRDRWDTLDEGIKGLQKRQEAHSMQWASYQDVLNQITAWLDSTEKLLQHECPSTWTSAQEIRSKLFKYKGASQDINSHKRIIEAVNEKADILIEGGVSTPENIQTTMTNIGKRYEQISELCSKLLLQLEEAFEVYQTFGDLQKLQQDYQKSLWDRLTGFSDYSGSKLCLQARLAKINEILETLPDGKEKLRKMEDYIEKNAIILPARSKDGMARDLINLSVDYEKFGAALCDVKSSLENRVQQWTDHENNLDHLLAWLDESEHCLKNYVLKSLLEEKQEQLLKFQELFSNLRQQELLFEQMKDESSELLQNSGETRLLVNIQQIASRLQSIQAAAKEIIKNCEQGVHDHTQYNDKFKQCHEWIVAAQKKYNECLSMSSSGSRQDLLQKQHNIKELKSEQNNAVHLINNTVELGEKCYPSTAAEGREIIRKQLQRLQQLFEQYIDNITELSRATQTEISKWSGFDELAEKLCSFLNSLDKTLHEEMELKTTLDEKRAKLQNYRDTLVEINNAAAELATLKDVADNLPEKTDENIKKLMDIVKHFEILHNRAQDFVERYEAIVSDHQRYCKAVMDTQEFIEATNNTVDLWGDLDLERISLHTNLDKLKSLKESLADEFPRIDQVRALGEKVIPGTIDSGKINIQSQIDNTQQEWQGLLSNISSVIEAIENRLLQWGEFENLRDQCLLWIRETDSSLHAVDLKSTVGEKQQQFETLKTLQGEIRAKELEVDNVTEKAQQLYKGSSTAVRGSHASELVFKYQQVTHKVKELTNRWQNYVANHQEFESNVNEFSQWIDDMRKKLDYCSDSSSMSQRDIEGKLAAIQDLILMKDEGALKIQSLIESAQIVLANTAPSGHDLINKTLSNIQEEWSNLVVKMVDVKSNLDESMNQWSGYLEQIQNVRKTVDWLENTLKELSEYQTTMPEKRAQLDRIRTTEEKVRLEKIDVDTLKLLTEEMMTAGQQSQAAYQSQLILSKFDDLANLTKKLLNEREEEYRAHKLYKQAYDDLVSWTSRAREKIPYLQQSSLSDKLAIENAVSSMDALLKKQAQGELLLEHLTHTGKVVLASTSQQGQEIIRNDIRALRESFESLFREIATQKEQLEITMFQWRDYKDEYERLLEWLQQIDIIVKNHKINLLPTIIEKTKQLSDMKSVMEKLEKGKDDIDRFNKSATGLLSSHLDTYINNQLRHLNSMYQVQVNLAKDVLKKVETNLEQHQDFEESLKKSHLWIDNAKDIIRNSSEVSAASTKEVLQNRLAQIQNLMRKREEVQVLVHHTINTGEKIIRSTRSDGREVINNQMRELQNDWDRIVKKMATSKVHVETSLLQWADYSSSYLQLQQWISEREAKLQQVCEQKVAKSKKGQPGLSSGLSERKANLRQTNNIVQDIVSFEPMIQSVTSKASDLQQAQPATEISTKYESLSKQARDLYEKQKNTIETHQALIDAGNEFAQWLRNAKERLSKCAEAIGDKEALANKILRLKILESEIPEGQSKLEKALQQGEIACRIAEEDDREIIEEEVALLQEEFDSFVETVKKAKSYLETGILKWTEYQDQYTEALDWLTKTETLVQSYNKLQNSLERKKNALEEFQGHLQTLFDWQKELDRLNVKAQTLLETCADTRISNAITQLTTKYNALMTLAKEVMRRLELHYQEHHQHYTLYEECQTWIEKTREKLVNCQDIPSSLSEVQIKLNTVKNIRQGFEQGQNKLRYLLELKEKVIMNTEVNGVAKIQDDTENLKQDFEKLLVDINDVRQKLMSRASQLEEIYKLYKVLIDWLAEIEPSTSLNDEFFNDLSEKRVALEKFRSIQRDISSHNDIIEKINLRLKEDDHIDPTDFEEGLTRFDTVQVIVNKHIESMENQVNNHEKYKQAYNEVNDWIRKTRMEVDQNTDSHGEKAQVLEKLDKLRQIDSSMANGHDLLETAVNLSKNVIETSGHEGQDVINQEIKGFKVEWEMLQTSVNNAISKLNECLLSWNNYIEKSREIKSMVDRMDEKFQRIAQSDCKSSEDLKSCKGLLEEVMGEKDCVEELNDLCEVLMEMSACSNVRDQTLEIQSNYSKLLTNIKYLVSKIEKNLSDHTEFINLQKEMNAWMKTANEVLVSCSEEGDCECIQQQLDSINVLAGRLPEGQHLLGTVQDAYTRATNVLSENKQEELRENMQKLRSDWDELNLTVKQKLISLKQAQSRWTDYYGNKSKIGTQLDELNEQLLINLDSRAELSEMKTLLERYKNIQKDVSQKKIDLENLLGEAGVLGADSDGIQKLKTRWEKLNNLCAAKINAVENEISDYSMYHQRLQDAEKWLLQVSFQLMAHNSLFISNREQTQQQISQHEVLLEEIQKYQSNIDELTSLGQGQIERYVPTTPSIKHSIETQLKNINDSYSSLLYTSVQIKNRLLESLSKFQEYEDALDAIFHNLSDYEPLIQTELDQPTADLSTAQNQLKCAQDLQNKLFSEKAKLTSAIQACEAATASISRPSSPLETAMHSVPERELVVRAKLENLLEQVRSHVEDLTANIANLEQQEKQKLEIQDWIKKQSNVVSDWASRPCKLRLEAGKQDLLLMKDLLGNIGDRRSQVMTDMIGSLGDNDLSKLQQDLDVVEEKLMEAIAKKQSGQDTIEKYRQSVLGLQNWFDDLIKQTDLLEKGSGLHCEQKLAAIYKVRNEFKTDGPERMSDVKAKANQVLEIISNLDGQQVEEQLKSLDRRNNDLVKRIDRKAQLLEATNKGIIGAKDEIHSIHDWVREKLNELKNPALIGHETKSAEARQAQIKSLLKDSEAKQNLAETLEKRIVNMQHELEPAELSQLESAFRDVAADQKDLSSLLTLELERSAEAAKVRKAYETDIDKVKAWLKAKLAEFKKVSQFYPLTSQGIELELISNKKFGEEIKSFGENALNDVMRQSNTILRECPDNEKTSFQNLLDEIIGNYNMLKEEIGNRIKFVSDLLLDRRSFENKIDNFDEWLNEIDANLSIEVYISNLPGLEEQLSKFKLLSDDCLNKNALFCNISDHAKNITTMISNADKLKLSEHIKILKERYLRLSQSINNRCKTLEEHIRKHKDAKSKLNDCILFLNSIQNKLKELNKPVGSRIEDVQELLKAYEIILNQLKNNKVDMSNLQINDIPELKSVIIQQDDMIRLIEDQLTHLKQLLLLREQFIALINEIIEFILKYTEIVNEIEKVPSSIEEKISEYDKIIGKVQECEALLAAATDKGHKIASEGTTADRNSITEQLQSLKNQLQGLRKAVELQKQKHQLTLDEHKKLLADLSECLNILQDNEGLVKSRPLLDRDPDSVEREIQKHIALANDVKVCLENLKKLCDAGESKVGLPSLIGEMISEAKSLLSTLPLELEDRETYLKNNKQSRIDYMDFVSQFNSWIHEAETRLQNGQHGVDYEHIDEDLEEHKNFFGRDGFVKDLVSRKIQEAADKIWPSLNQIEQDELSRELKQHSETLQRLLSKARDTQTRLEEQSEKWKQYGQHYVKIKNYLERLNISDEVVSTLTELHSNIQKIARAINNAQAFNADIDLLNQEAQNLIRQADAENRQRIDAENLLLNKDWEKFVNGLQNRHEVLTSLAEVWGTFENKLHTFEKHLIRLEEKCANVDLVVKSRRQLDETKDALQEIIGESEDLKSSFKEIEVLSGPIINFVKKSHSSSQEALQAKINKLAEQHKRLNEILRDKDAEARKLLEQIETIFRKISETQDKLNNLLEEINDIYVYNEDYSNIENVIIAISSKVKNVTREAEEILRSTRENYITEKSLLPSDVAQELTALELLSERLVSAMDRKENEFKRAKTIRTEYITGVDEIQKWIHKAESDIEKRNLEPLQLKDILHCINIEFTNIRDKLHNVKQNASVIIENSRNREEKELVQKTIDQLTQQIEHIRTLLEMKRQQVGDSLDAWTRFMNLYQIVMSWVSDKKIFLSESLILSTLPESRQKLNEYSLAVKTLKPIVKNLSEMDKELELISQITLVGELKSKLQEAEDAKVEVEAILLQRNALLQEVTEEWEQCEKKIRDIRVWIDKTKSNLESLQQKRKPLRDQLGYCEKTIAEINVQKSKLALSIEKLEVHFRSGIGGDARLSENVDEILKILDELSTVVRNRTHELEESINQIDTYQEQMQELRQKIIQEEQHLRLLLTPKSNTPDFEKIVADQEVCRENIRDLQSKINARNERIRTLISRGKPDDTMLHLQFGEEK